MTRVGVIGLGVGLAHLEAAQMHPTVTSIVACDFDEAKLQAAQQKFSRVQRITTHADEVVAAPDIDVVVVASYENNHHAQILAALKAGKHIFAEKPVCLFRTEAESIYQELQKRPQQHFSSNLILRRSPRFMEAKELVTKGELGKLFFLEGDYNYGRIQKITDGWRGKLPFYSPTLGGGIHIIDLMLWMSGARVKQVSALGNKIVTQDSTYRYNDCIVALLEFANGLIGKVAVNLGGIYPHHHRFSLYGTKATFENTLEGGLLFKRRDGEGSTTPEKIQSAYPGVHKGELFKEFLNAIVRNERSEPSIRETFDGLAICFAIDEAIAAGRSTSVSYLD
jgi:predicted dehydrogenase